MLTRDNDQPITLAPARPIIHRTIGERQGFLTHLLHPGNGGELVKPFVALDLFEADTPAPRGFAPHPHSGIATHSTFLLGTAHYADSTGKSGILEAGSVEWMQSGSGVWHGGQMGHGQPFRGFQLWLSLPPELELAPAESLYLEAARIPNQGGVRLLLGSYRGMASEIAWPGPITYLHVRLHDGESWTYEPATDHDIAWLAVDQGALEATGAVLKREFAIYADGNGPIALRARGDAEFVIGSAARHPYPLVCAPTSIHTNIAALAKGRRHIAELQSSPAVTSMRPG